MSDLSRVELSWKMKNVSMATFVGAGWAGPGRAGLEPQRERIEGEKTTKPSILVVELELLAGWL